MTRLSGIEIYCPAHISYNCQYSSPAESKDVSRDTYFKKAGPHGENNSLRKIAIRRRLHTLSADEMPPQTLGTGI